jgi:hypothetical protein
VGHKQHGPRLVGQRARQPRLHLTARDRVQRSERLIQAQHRLAGQQRAQERHALAHAAAELVHASGLEALEPEVLEQRARLPARRLAPVARDPPRQRRVVDRAQPWQQRVALGHQHGRRAVAGALVRPLQPADDLQQRRLAAAAGPDDGNDLLRRDGQRQVRERDDRPVGAVYAGELDPAIDVHRSLRGHYPTGSKGQIRVADLSQPAVPPAPL